MNPLLLKVGIFVAMLVSAYIAGCTHEKSRFDDYKTSVEAVSKARDAERLARNQARRQAKEQADAQSKTERNKLNATIIGLRKQLAGRQFIQGSDSNAKRPDLACFPREEFIGALQRYRSGVLQLIEEGTGAVLDLDVAKKWALTIKEVE
jgi:hypothetical protein